MQDELAGFLASAAEAQDFTDLNIAAGVALEELDRRPSRVKPMLRKTAATIVSIVAVTVVGDTFAASPVHAGISPLRPPHIFTRLGAPDWGDQPNADVFGHALPWRAHDGWLERLLGG